MKGIDVSYHNGMIDWGKVRQSVDFAIIRAGYGKSQVDKQFVNNIEGASTAGLKVGIYWFIYAANTAESILNAQMCERCIKKYKDKISMRIWADWEYDSDKRNPQTKESRTAIVETFCDYLSSKGYEVGVYSNVDYITGKFGDLSKYPLWLAKYSDTKGDFNPFMWQYSSKGKIAGISTDVDMNEYYGNMPEQDAPVKSPFTVGRNYTLQANMRVRKSPNGENKMYSQLTTNAKSHAVKQADGTAVLKKGTVVTCKDVEYHDGGWWVKIPSGYVCGIASDGKVYMK